MLDDHPEEQLREILERALAALESGRYEHIYRRCPTTGRRVVWHLERDLERLDACCPKFKIADEETYFEIIFDCLEKALENPSKHYQPPEEDICTHPEAEGLEMFAFVVELDDFTRAIYTKFCLKELSDGEWYVSIDCHT
jgi:hypothetical protein